MIIRRADNEERKGGSDFLQIAALDRVAWSDNTDNEFIPDGEHAWRIWVNHTIVFCAEKNNKISGAILAFPTNSNIYCLHKIFVSEKSRGMGLANLLITSLLDEIDKKQVSLFLTVDPDNKSAIALYSKYGFTDQQFVAGYYRANEDRLVLTRPVSTA